MGHHRQICWGEVFARAARKLGVLRHLASQTGGLAVAPGVVPDKAVPLALLLDIEGVVLPAVTDRQALVTSSPVWKGPCSSLNLPWSAVDFPGAAASTSAHTASQRPQRVRRGMGWVGVVWARPLSCASQRARIGAGPSLESLCGAVSCDGSTNAVFFFTWTADPWPCSPPYDRWCGQ